MRKMRHRLKIVLQHLRLAVEKWHKASSAVSAFSGLLSLNLVLLSSSLNSPLEQLLKVLWFQDVHEDKTFHTQRLRVKLKKKKKSPNTEAAHWRQLVMIPPWLFLRTAICKHLIPEGLSWGKATGGRLLEEVSSVMTSCLSWWVWCWDRIMMTDEAVQNS